MSWWIQSGNGNEIKFQNSTFKFPWFTWCQLPPGKLTCPVKRDHFFFFFPVFAGQRGPSSKEKSSSNHDDFWGAILVFGGGGDVNHFTDFTYKDLASSCPFKMAKFAWMETHPKYPKSATLFLVQKWWDLLGLPHPVPPEGCLSANSEKSKNATASCVILTTTSMGKNILSVAHRT